MENNIEAGPEKGGTETAVVDQFLVGYEHFSWRKWWGWGRLGLTNLLTGLGALIRGVSCDKKVEKIPNAQNCSLKYQETHGSRFRAAAGVLKLVT